MFATHADRKRLFVEAGHLIIDLTKRYYEQDDSSVLPRNIATFQAFENAMTVDIAMGGSTNTVLHLLAAAHEAKIDFTMRDIDRLSRRVPVLCKVAPSVPDVHLEDVHRAGGASLAILGELNRVGLIDPVVGTVHSATLGDASCGFVGATVPLLLCLLVPGSPILGLAITIVLVGILGVGLGQSFLDRHWYGSNLDGRRRVGNYHWSET